jgi:monoamine oxidase
MAHTPMFQRLRRLMAMTMWARRSGVTDPAEIETAFEQRRLERRKFLQTAAVTGLAAAVPWTAPGCGDDSTGPGTPAGDRVAVVGGGIAGLHCAYRLSQAGVKATVYEAQDRVGGRMWTGRDLFPDGQVFEIGGELIDSNHATLWALVDELGIEVDDRWSFEKPGMIRDTWYVDGARVTNETLLHQMLEVADKMASDVEAADSNDAAFERLDNTTLADWFDDNVPVASYPELHAVLSVAYRGEFGLENDRQSCLNFLYLIGYDSDDEFLIFGDSDERYHTHLGNDTFPTKLAEALDPGQIVKQAQLTRVAKNDDGSFALTLKKTSDGSPLEVEVDHVVFALPFSTLREVDLEKAGLSKQKLKMIQEIGYGTNAKVMLGFDRRVWWEDHNEAGSVGTDLGVQQAWDTSIGQDGDHGILTNFLGAKAGVDSGEGPPSMWAEKVLPDLEQIWPGMEEAFTGDVQRMHWPSFKWMKGSYTCYLPGQWSFWSTEGAREGNLHFCGEHTSLDFQGWMEGGAETGGLVAAEILDDLGKEVTAKHGAAIEVARSAPHACYHGDKIPRLRWRERRRVMRAAWAARGLARAKR